MNKYIYIAVAVLIAGLGGFAYWQYARANEASEALAQAKVTLDLQETTIKDLGNQIKTNDAATLAAATGKAKAAAITKEKSRALEQASKQVPAWADQPVPDGILDSLR